jgi:RNA polymerase sigma-70 factor (ECF subfamily)
MSAPATPQSTATDNQTDHSLVAAYQDGEERAATELVARHSAAIARYLYGSGAGADDVEDLVQETLFRAFRKLASWRREASFRTWLLTIAGNLLKDQARSRGGRVVVALEMHDVAGASDPHADLAQRDLESRLGRELARLPRLQREVFLLRAQQGAEYPEIASALGTSAGAARVHYHNAVKRLKELFR